MSQQLQLVDVEREQPWCPSRCPKRCDAHTCTCGVCHCPACRLRSQIAQHGRAAHIDLPARPAYQPRLFTTNNPRSTR